MCMCMCMFVCPDGWFAETSVDGDMLLFSMSKSALRRIDLVHVCSSVGAMNRGSVDPWLRGADCTPRDTYLSAYARRGECRCRK